VLLRAIVGAAAMRLRGTADGLVGASEEQEAVTSVVASPIARRAKYRGFNI